MSYTCGKYTYGAENLIIKWEKMASLTIGNFCSIGENITIYLGGNHRTEWITTYPFGHIHQDIFPSESSGHPSTNGNVNIGNDVWIGSNVTIMSGVTIGDGAVIANNSHIVKNVEPYSVTGGNPAKLIKLRFSPDEIRELLEIKWWDWDDQRIREHIPLLRGSNISAFIEFAREK